MNKIHPSRNLNLDLIRAVAVICVLCVHFFLHNDFYYEPVVGKRMYIMVCMRTFFMICVPLFLVLTGYLQNHKKISKKYYFGVTKILLTYILASIFCIIFNKFYFGKDYGPVSILFSILDFSACSYAWYIEMYLGLFLLIPFLNILYHNLESTNHKLLLVGSLLALTALPSVLNIHDITNPDFWLHPSKYSAYQDLVPSWWVGIYPITYYYLGAFLSEYRPTISTGRTLLLLLVSTVAFGSFNYYRYYESTFIQVSFVDWQSFENVINCVLVFILLLNLNLDKCPKIIAHCIHKIAELSLGIYLCSIITDRIVYPILNQHVPVMNYRLNYFPVVILASFSGAAILSQLVNWLQKLIEAGLSRLLSKK